MASILVLDDDPDVVGFMTRMLESEGFDVVSAQTEKDGLAIINGSNDLDLAIIDFWLGPTPSLELLDAIEARRPDLPVVVMSGGGGGVSLEVSHSASRLRGAKSFIQKPFTRDDLVVQVRGLLGASE